MNWLTELKRKRILALTGKAAALAAVAGSLHAQTQPAGAINNQDEQVNINKQVGEGDSRFTIFRSGDKAEIYTYISEVVELKHAEAYEVLPHVRQAVTREKGAVRTLKYTDPKDGTFRYFIQVITTKEQMPSVIETIHAIDLPGMESSEGNIKYHYRLKNRKASDLLKVLQGTSISGDGKSFADDITNSVYIEDAVSDFKRNIAVAKFYDVPPPQVEFEALAVEIETDNADRLGLDWDAWNRTIGGQFELTGNKFTDLDDGGFYEGGESFARLDALVTVDARALASFLNYTTQTGTGKVITKSTVTASNANFGVISSLKRIPSLGYVTTTADPKELIEDVPHVTAAGIDPAVATGKRPVVIVPPTRSTLTQISTPANQPGTSFNNPSRGTGEKAEGIYLLIRPTIGTELVTSEIELVVNSLSGYTQLDEPIITERYVSTQVTLKDGEPFTIGGLDKSSVTDVRRGIPGLKDIPVLRYLFSVESKAERRSRVYVVLTPTFRSQVNLTSPGLSGSKLDIDPGQIVNTDIPDALWEELRGELPVEEQR